jgi:hypothetical protein
MSTLEFVRGLLILSGLALVAIFAGVTVVLLAFKYTSWLAKKIL